jgi:aldose 1-epimerase
MTTRTFLGRQYVLTAGAHTATVTEVGAGLQRYAVDGVDVTVGYPDDQLPPKGCGSTLVPWPNRIKDGRYTFEGVDYRLALTEPEAGNAIHGLGRWMRWSKVRQSPDELVLRLDVVPQPGYPFPLRAEVGYRLDPSSGLTVTLSARNTGRGRAPFGAGSHPYLSTRGSRPDDVTLRLPARQILDVDDREIPTGSHPVSGERDFRRGRRLGARRLDCGFTDLLVRDGRGTAEVRTRSGGAQLWFDDAFRYLQVFTLDSLAGGPPGVAIEPMTCAPNAFNSGDGLLVLEPGQRWSASWGITPL